MIYMIRHGQTDWNLNQQIQGQKDIPLNRTGRAEADLSAQKIQSLIIKQVISSDLIRAKETAEIVNKYLNKQISFDKRLREINYGNIEGKQKKEISLTEWSVFNQSPAILGAESFEEVYQRVQSFCSDLLNKQDVLLVTHGGIIRMLMYFAVNPYFFDAEKYEKTYKYLKIKNGDVFVWNQNSSNEPVYFKRLTEK